ncbi:hypothetical protein Q8A73_009029 [Channa argus]|nr:hypothetical protein Q8A73_009029 [Channa argus]
MVPEAQGSSPCEKEQESEMKGTGKGEAGSFRFPLSISKIGLSLPRRCLFVSPRQGLTKQRMQTARMEEQEQAEGEKQRQIEEGGGSEPSLGWDHLRRLLC